MQGPEVSAGSRNPQVRNRELFDHFNGEVSLPGAIERIKISTRQYAKRQLTWFKKDNEFHWCLPDAAAVIAYLEEMADSWKLG